MKALYLWEPFASAMALGVKRNETRGRSISYRGDVVICASKHRDSNVGIGACKFLLAHFRHPEDDTVADTMARLPYGMALCVVNLYDCVNVDSSFTTKGNIFDISITERSLGDYSPGRYAWLTRNLRVLAAPVPVRGKQGLFNFEPAEAAAVAAALAK